jgi:sugar O-acyltransferase (sialic acid O-acetyltransferase NeuD family)
MNHRPKIIIFECGLVCRPLKPLLLEMKTPPILIIGTNDESIAALDILHSNEYFVYGFLSIEPTLTVSEILELPVLGTLADKQYQKILQEEKVAYILMETNSKTRELILDQLFKLCKRLPINAIHAGSIVAPASNMATGNIIHAGCIITAQVNMGSLNYIGAGTIIDSGAHVGSFNTIQAGARIGRQTTVGNHCFIGMGATIMGGLTIGDGAVIAAGSVVMQSVEDRQSVMGNPAHVLDDHSY